jgi:cystathionine gamma-synthase
VPTKPPTRRTLAAQALGMVDPSTGAIVAPLHIATTLQRDPDNHHRLGRAHGRPDNTTVRLAEGVIAALEGAGDAAPARSKIKKSK